MQQSTIQSMDDLEAGGGGLLPSAHPGLLRLPLSLLTSTSLAEIGRSRILVLGDAGVGKTMLVQRIAGRSVDEVRANAYSTASTTGCTTECKLFQCRSGATTAATAAQPTSMHSAHGGHAHNNSSLQHRISSAVVSPSSAAAASSSSAASSLLFLEFWDVSGHRKYEPSRSLFYRELNAIVFVFDLMNRKSYENIRKWIREIVRVDAQRGVEEERSGGAGDMQDRHSSNSSSSSVNSSPHQSPALRPSTSPSSPAHLGSSPSPLASALGSLPVLLIGTKADLYRPRAAEQGAYESVKDFGLDCLHLSAFDEADSNFAALDKFFERVCARKLARATDSVANNAAAAAAAAAGASRRYSSSAHSAPLHPGAAAASYPPVDSAHAMNNRRMAGFGSTMAGGGSGGGGQRASFSVGGSGGASHAPPSFASFSISESGAPPSVGPNYGAPSSAYSRSSAASGDSFVPPPIRTLADFTAMDDGGGSPASSPNVLSPSSSASPMQRPQPFYTQQHTPSYPAYPLAAASVPGSRSMRDARAPPSSLPANTALAALSQQRRGSAW